MKDILSAFKKLCGQLTSFGWRVLRFSGQEIYQTLPNCFKIIEKTISGLGGLTRETKKFLR